MAKAPDASGSSLEPSGGSTLPERAEAGISSRDTTSETNALSPAPPQTQMPQPSVSAPLPSVNASTINAPQVDQGITRPGPETLPSSIGVPGDAGKTVASGEEAPSRDFGITSNTPVLMDDDRGIMLAQGRTTLRYGAFTATGKRAVINTKSSPQTATLSDDLTVVARVNGREQTFRGESLSFNLDTGRWELSDIRATFPKELFPPGQVLAPLFLRDGRVFGTDEDTGGSDFKFSSCDKDHYDLQSREINFYRDEGGRPDRIALKHNALYVFGRKVLPLPNLVIPLQGRTSRRTFLQPQFGRNPIDGFFAKTVYDLSANSKRSDSLLIDALQKRGLGLGLQRELAGGAGLFYLYAVSGGQSGRQVDARLDRSFNIGRSVNPSSINFQSTTNNSLTGEGYSNSSGALNLDYSPESGGGGSLQLSTNNSKSPFSTFSQRQGSLAFMRQLGADWDVSLNTQYNGTQSRSGGLEAEGESTVDNQELLDNTLGLNRRGSRFDAALLIEKHNDLTGKTGSNGFSLPLERLPQLELNTDLQRLGLGALGQLLPSDISLSLGTYNESSTSQRLTRTRFAYDVRNRELQLIEGKRLRSRLNLSGGFRQSAYSNNTARYETETVVGFETQVGRQKEDADGSLFSLLRFDATYQKLKPTGYTPFQFDALSRNESATATAILQPSRRARLEIGGTRDIANNSNSPLRGTLRLLPSRFIGIDVSTAYSRDLRQFDDVLTTIEIQRPDDRFLGGAITLGVRYSPARSTFSTINLGANMRLNSKTRLQALTGYDGFSKQFVIQQYRVQRDLHCFNLFLGYDGQRKQIRFDLALKAFPFFDSRLGQNILGEGFDPALGAVR